MPISPVDKVWMNGQLVDWENATVHILTHALHYGTGVFEGIRCYETPHGPAVFRLRDHLVRMERSGKIFLTEIPYSVDELIAATHALIKINKLQSCYVRPIAYRGFGEIGLYPANNPVDVAIAVWSWGTYLGDEALKKGIRMTVSSWRRHDPNITTSHRTFLSEKPGRTFRTPGMGGIRWMRQFGIARSSPSWSVRMSTWCPRPLRNSSTVRTASGVPRA